MRQTGGLWLIALALTGAASVRAQPVPPAAPAEVDSRSREFVDLDCRSDISRTRLTLFANGTVRLREGIGESARLRLGELAPEALDGWRQRLLLEDLREVEAAEPSAEGPWIETCSLALDRAALEGEPGREPPRRIRFVRWAAMPLPLSRLLAVLADLAVAANVDVGGERLPADYVPRIGDVLRRGDGENFRLVAPTADGKGWEVAGVVVPLTMFLPKEEIPRVFVALVRRGGP